MLGKVGAEEVLQLGHVFGGEAVEMGRVEADVGVARLARRPRRARGGRHRRKARQAAHTRHPGDASRPGRCIIGTFRSLDGLIEGFGIARVHRQQQPFRAVDRQLALGDHLQDQHFSSFMGFLLMWVEHLRHP
jgi:hypothetical protein